MSTQQIEKLATRLASMSRDDLTKTLRKLQCNFRIDFTDDFLNSISDDRLRHIVMAASLHAHDMTAARSA